MAGKSDSEQIWPDGGVRVVPLTPSNSGLYSGFATRLYGSSSYQASGNYPHWLSLSGPNGRGLTSGFVALDAAGQVHGAILRMVLPRGLGRSPTVSLQNLMVLPQSRGGLGFLLVKKAMSGSGQVIVPGVSGRFASTYEVMKGSRIPTKWRRAALNPLRTLQRLPMWASSNRNHPMALAKFLRNQDGRRFGSSRLVTIPSDDHIAMIAARAGRQQSTSVEWDPPLIRWRLFSPFGPQSAMLVRDDGSYAVVSFGWLTRRRLGVPIARLLELHSEGAPDALIASSRSLAQLTGAYQLLTCTVDDALDQALERHGFVPYQVAPVTYSIERDRGAERVPWTFDPLSTDLGLEGIPR